MNKRRRVGCSVATTVVVCISFIYAVVFMASPPLLSNHSTTLKTLRLLVAAEEAFHSQVLKDEDQDGIGEYGTLQEVIEAVPSTSPHSWVTRVLTEEQLTMGQRGAYVYHIDVPSDADLAEERFFITAWPRKYGKRSALLDGFFTQHGLPPFGPTGTMTFCAEQSGKVLVADIAGAKARPEDVENLDVWMTSEEWVFATSSSERGAASER